MSQQTTDTLLMIRPVRFSYNTETAGDNYYQKQLEELGEEEIQNHAVHEFDQFVKLLRSKNIRVIVVDDTPKPATPDSIFPNNWVSFHENGSVGLYPMFAPNRRPERREDILTYLADQEGFIIRDVKDFSHNESKSAFLEGTGSMILDRENRVVYAALSERTSTEVLKEFCDNFGYSSVTFHSFQTVDDKRLPIYHTNVMMCVADKFAILCKESIDDEDELHELIDSLEQSGKRIIPISEVQTNHFAGNMLQVHAANEPENKFLIMSESAFESLTQEQIEQIESFCPILYSPLKTIETIGGGSARCMMAEIFLPSLKVNSFK